MLKKKLSFVDSDSDEEDDAQIRQFLEAADHTLLTNDLYQKSAEDLTTSQAPPGQGEAPKSERYLDAQSEHAAAASELQISKDMQRHIWGKLSTIIQNQIEFYAVEEEEEQSEKHLASPWISQVKLVSNADCYISTELPQEIAGPQRKPIIKKRQLEQDDQHRVDLATVAVSGDSILKGYDMQCWAQRKPRKDKFFEYKSCDSQGHKLQALAPINEFSAQRRKNNWNESKICQGIRNSKIKKKSLD